MLINQLELTNFRNYESCVFRPEKGINLIVGENAQGKTNLLEAVFFCCFGRSHRTCLPAGSCPTGRRAADSAAWAR